MPDLASVLSGPLAFDEHNGQPGRCPWAHEITVESCVADDKASRAAIALLIVCTQTPTTPWCASQCAVIVVGSDGVSPLLNPPREQGCAFSRCGSSPSFGL